MGAAPDCQRHDEVGGAVFGTPFSSWIADVALGVVIRSVSEAADEAASGRVVN